MHFLHSVYASAVHQLNINIVPVALGMRGTMWLGLMDPFLFRFPEYTHII